MPQQAGPGTQGTIPAWTLLEPESLRALLSADGRLPRAVRVAADARPAEVASVPVVSTARLTIERALAHGGLRLTARGALSRADTGALLEATTWPGFSKEDVWAGYKVLNEADVLPIHFTRLLLQAAGLLRRRKGLLATKLGKELVDPDRAAALFGLLFEKAFWRINLSYFDGIPIEYWPQNHIGVVLWCLSVTAHSWAAPERLAHMCTVPDRTLVGTQFYYPDSMLELRVLRPLTWFGLMESMQPPEKTDFRYRKWYRKSALFDHVLAFHVDLRRPSGALQ